MSDLLSIGASGVRAFQTALTTVSENIANAGSASYVRRTVPLSEIIAIGGKGANGMGVGIGATTRSFDVFRSNAVRTATADLARTKTSSSWLEQIQAALTGTDLGGRMTDFFNAAKTLAADPTSTAARSVMLEQAETAAASFRETGEALAQASADLDGTANQAVTGMNSLGASLAKVNEALGKAKPGTAAAAGLADQRDAILEEMSALSDIDVQLDSVGRATVALAGKGGPTFVAGNQAGTLSYVRGSSGAVAFVVSRAGTSALVSPNGGALAGIAEGAQKIVEARTALDGLAKEFVEGVNKVQAGGEDLNGAAGKPMFAVGTSPTDITVAIDDPKEIAAAKPGEGTRGNGNLAALDSLRTTAGFEGKLTSLVATNAAAIESRATVIDAQTAIRTGALAARDAISGVDLDSEAIDLMRFQQAYSASSRVIQAARDTFQSILAIN
jgi:flagellar hook-associated protein 1 FlgK